MSYLKRAFERWPQLSATSQPSGEDWMLALAALREARAELLCDCGELKGGALCGICDNYE